MIDSSSAPSILSLGTVVGPGTCISESSSSCAAVLSYEVSVVSFCLRGDEKEEKRKKENEKENEKGRGLVNDPPAHDVLDVNGRIPTLLDAKAVQPRSCAVGLRA